MAQRHPTQSEFLQAPIETVRRAAPATAIFAAGGTRRSAVLAGIPTDSDQYAAWVRQQMMACFELLFHHGIQHLIAPILTPGQFAETTRGYRESLVRWIQWGIGGREAQADYARLDCRVRLVGAETVPELLPLNDALVKTTAAYRGPSLWFTVVVSESRAWQHVIQAARQAGVDSLEALMQAAYGASIPPATLYIGYGKTEIFPALCPPLLMGKLQCYWKQQPGYLLDGQVLRLILFDYAYTRRTWRADKTGRAEQALARRATWQNAPVYGLGRRLGPFWFPQPFPESEDP